MVTSPTTGTGWDLSWPNANSSREDEVMSIRKTRHHLKNGIITNMKNEYEAKYFEINTPELTKKLTGMHAKLVMPKRLMTRMIFENDLTKGQHGWVRLRDEKDKITLAYKQVNNSQTIEGTKEIEITVDSIDQAAEFLQAVGLEKVRFQQNYRESWELDKTKFDFDTWPGLATFLEIEADSPELVQKYSNLLGLDYAKARFGSIDELYKTELDRDILAEKELIF